MGSSAETIKYDSEGVHHFEGFLNWSCTNLYSLISTQSLSTLYSSGKLNLDNMNSNQEEFAHQEATRPAPVRRLLDAGANVNTQDKYSRPPLRLYIESDEEDDFDNGIVVYPPRISIKVPVHGGSTPLILASRYGMKPAFDKLMRAGANVKAVDDFRKTALHWVALNRSHDTESARAIANSVQMLLDAGADVNAQDKYNRTPLHLAVEVAEILVIQSLLSHTATNCNARMLDGRTPLMLASHLAVKDAVTDLISAGADVNAADDCGKTALHWVATRGSTDNGSGRLNCAQMLIHAGVDVNARDKNGRTPLHFAVTNGEVDVIEALLRNPKTQLNARTHEGATPLMFASRFAIKDIFNDLISAGANVNAEDVYGKTALHWAATNVDDDDELSVPEIESDVNDYYDKTRKCITVSCVRPIAVKRLLDAGADVNARDQTDRTPLHLAVETDGIEIVRALLDHPATNLNARMNNGATPLILASRRLLKASCTMLITAGANTNVGDINEKTALHWVSISREDGTEDARLAKPEIAKRLLDAGADANSRDRNGRTPLHTAIEYDARSVVPVLLRHPATNLNAQMYDGTTPLISAVRFAADSVLFLDLVIKAGANIDDVDNRGDTALHWAVNLENEEAVNELLECGANTDIQDNVKGTPLHYAAELGNDDLCRMLLSKFANRDLKDIFGRLPRDIAEMKNYQDMVTMLVNEFMPAG